MDFDHPPPDPIGQFNAWFEEARHIGLPNPNAMALATVDSKGQPSARIVLLKTLDARGAVFYTNFASRKGRELAANPRAALLFHWDALNRQVRIEGNVSRVANGESDAYFATRPREAQIGAWASAQSQPINGRASLDTACAEIVQRFADRPVPRPPNWGGFRVSLESMEFWEGHPHRLHDRVVYARVPNPGAALKWRTTRLSP